MILPTSTIQELEPRPKQKLLSTTEMETVTVAARSPPTNTQETETNVKSTMEMETVTVAAKSLPLNTQETEMKTYTETEMVTAVAGSIPPKIQEMGAMGSNITRFKITHQKVTPVTASLIPNKSQETSLRTTKSLQTKTLQTTRSLKVVPRHVVILLVLLETVMETLAIRWLKLKRIMATTPETLTSITTRTLITLRLTLALDSSDVVGKSSVEMGMETLAMRRLKLRRMTATTPATRTSTTIKTLTTLKSPLDLAYFDVAGSTS
jgi:hypothetical protein